MAEPLNNSNIEDHNSDTQLVHYASSTPSSTTTPRSAEEPMSAALFAAAVHGHHEIIQENKSYLSSRFTRTGNSVLHIASDFGQLRCVQEILRLSREVLHVVNFNGETAVHLAAKRGHLLIIKELVQAAAAESWGNPEDPDDVERGTTAGAIGRVSWELLRMTNKKGSTALHEAARYGHSFIVEYLADNDSNFTYGPNLAGETPLYIAAERGHQKSAIAILKKCESPAYEGPHGKTALHAAVISNSKVITKEIMERRPDLGKKTDNENWAPLHWAAFYDRSLRVTQLLCYDESLAYIPDENGQIPLHVAASRGRNRSMRALISKCPDCYDIVDNRGRNVIHHAALNKQLGIIRELRPSPLFARLLNEGDEEGNTPLHLYPGYELPRGFLSSPPLDRFAVNAEGLTFVEAMRRRKPVKQQKDNRYDELKLEIETHLIVAALVATVTFAAGFTFPGDYADNGTAKLSATSGFRCFIISDMIALILSFFAIRYYFISVYYIYSNTTLARRLVLYGNRLCIFAILSTVIAFVAATSITSGSSAISTTIIIFGVAFLIIYYPLHLPRFINIFIEVPLSWATGSHMFTRRCFRVTRGSLL